MTTEQKLIEALRAVDDYEASGDLYARVVHSIEEDRRHRARVRSAAVTAAVVAVVLFALAVTSLESASIGGIMRYRVRWQMMESLEFIALGTLVVVLGPAIRRFGRGYVRDLFGTATDAADQLLRLLDVAYYLVFAGFVLVTARFAAPVAYRLYDLGDQIEQLMRRVAGLIVMMGILHASTLMILPLIGLVFTTTRRGAKLPRWVTVLLVVVGILGAWQAAALAGMVGLAD